VRRPIGLVTVALASVLALAMSGIATARVNQGQVRGVTDDEIIVGGLGPANPFQQFGGELGAKARFQIENDKGGVFGREINYIGWADDAANADTNLAEAQRLVQQEGVFAIVPMLSPVFLQAGEFLEQQHVPSFGWGISSAFCTTRWAFGFNGCQTPPPPVKFGSNTWGGLIDEYFKSKGDGGAKGKTVAVISEDNDSGKSGVTTITATAKAVGMKVVYSKASVPPADPTPVADVSPYINDLMTADDGEPPDVLMLVLAAPTLQKFHPALNDAGYPGLQTNAALYSPLAVGIVKGSTVVTGTATPEAAADSPAMQEFLDAVAAVDPEAIINQPTLAGYVAADFFIKALKKAGKNLTPEKVQKAAAKMTFSIPGFVGPTKYPKAFTRGTPCGQFTQSDGTEWNVVVPFTCFENVKVKSGDLVKY
jgi:branched-chain amino acid transport system substrate-binding protein